MGKDTLFLTPPSFEWGMKIPKNWVGGGDQFLRKSSGQEGMGKKKYKIVGVAGFFHFNLLTISHHGNWYCF